MMTEHIIEQLKSIIASKLDVNIHFDDIQEDAPLFEEGLGLDSIAIMELITLIEAEFNFKFTELELDMEQFKDIQTLAHLIAHKLKGQASEIIETNETCCSP